MERAWLRALFVFARDALLLLDAQGRIVELSGGVEALLGVQASVLQGKSFPELAGLAESFLEVPTVRRNGLTLIWDDRPVEIEVKTRKRKLRLSLSDVQDGTSRNFLVLLQEPDASEASGECVASEESKRAAHDARWVDASYEQRGCLGRLFDSLLAQDAVGFGLADTDGNILAFNSFFARFIGLKEERGEALRVKDFHDEPETREFHEAILPQVQEFGAWVGERAFRRPDGVKVSALHHAILVREPTGEPCCFANIILTFSAQDDLLTALTSSRDRQKALLQALPDLVLRLDRDGVFLDAHVGDEALLFMPLKDFLGKPLTQLPFPAPFVREVSSRIEGTLRTGKMDTYFYSLPVEGETRDYEARIVRASVDEVLVIVRDLTERIRNKRTLSAQQTRLRLLFEHAPIGIGLSDAQGNLLSTNKRMCSLLGYAPEELVGQPISKLSHPEDFLKERPMLVEMLAGTRESFTLEKRYIKKSGEHVWTELTLLVIHEPDEQLFFLGLVTDLTERRKAEETIRKSEERYRSVVAALREGIMQFDTEGRVIACNKSAEELLGLTHQQILGLEATELCSRGFLEDGTPFPQERCPVRSTLSSGEGCNNLVMGMPDPRAQARKWLSINAQPIWGEDPAMPQSVVVSLFDITGHKKSQQELRLAKRRAEEALSAKKEFLAMVSHEIRTPMNGILGTISLLSQTELAAEQQEFLEIISNSSRALLAIIEDILDFSSAEMGHLSLRVGPFFVGEIAQEVVALLRPKAEGKGVALRLVLPATIPLLCGDGGRIRQILLNLVSNALKFTEEGVVELRVECETEEARDEQLCALRLCVQDTGVGIAQAHQEMLFEPFTQADSSATRKFEGTGLGLSISKRLVELMGGEIGLQSTLGEGSLFWVDLRLPFASQEQTQGFEEEKAQSTQVGFTLATRSGRKRELMLVGRVLVVDDNAVSRRVLLLLLSRWGLEVEEAKDGREALERWRKDDFDVILMDWRMPELDGLEVTRLIREEERQSHAHTYIIALTASVLSSTRQSFLEVGVDEILTKPVQPERLAACLSRYMPPLEDALQH